jgi:hypothetical protein
LSSKGPEASSDFVTAFKHNFLHNMMPMLLDSHLTLVFKRKSHFVATRPLIYSLSFHFKAVKVPQAMEIMHPYLENLLFETAVPIVLVTTHDLYLFKDDPIEYLRKYQDTSVETRQSTRLCMINFLQGLVSFKAQKYDA